jgi:hypothetical protein
MVKANYEIRTAKELGITEVPDDKLYALHETFDDERPLPLYGANKSKATYGWVPLPLLDEQS